MQENSGYIKKNFFSFTVFIYSMPGYSCPIKERMLYSSSRNPITEYIENYVNVGITKKVSSFLIIWKR